MDIELNPGEDFTWKGLEFVHYDSTTNDPFWTYRRGGLYDGFLINVYQRDSGVEAVIMQPCDADRSTGILPTLDEALVAVFQKLIVEWDAKAERVSKMRELFLSLV
jgi:hypothetical protein